MHWQNQSGAIFKESRTGHFSLFFPAERDVLRQHVEAFLLHGERPCISFGAATAERGVYFIESEAAVLKHSRPRRWGVRLRNGLRIKRSGKNCLADEFSNLQRLAASDLVPNAHGYARRWIFGFLFEEALVIEYFVGSRTLDDLLQDSAAVADVLVPRVFDLFSKMLDQGFVHLDPHPNNILVTPSGDMKLIDFEGCCFDISDRPFCLAYCVGRLFRFWLVRFISESQYDRAVLALVAAEKIASPHDFMAMYDLFKNEKVSRKKCHQIFSTKIEREKFIARAMARGWNNAH